VKGDMGLQGVAGPQGPAGGIGTETVRASTSTGSSATAFCQGTEKAVGGRGNMTNASDPINDAIPVTADGSLATGGAAVGWKVTAGNGKTGVTAYVVCVP
jgi:hypothetical protein